MTSQEEATVKEQRVDDIVRWIKDHEMRGVTKMRMDEMLMDQVMAVSSGTSCVCVNEENTSQRQSEDCPRILSRKVQAREMKDL